RHELPATVVAYERELVDAGRYSLALPDDLEVGAQIGELAAVNRHLDVLDGLAKRRRIWVLLEPGQPILGGLRGVHPLTVALSGHDNERLRCEIGVERVEVVIAESKQEVLDEGLNRFFVCRLGTKLRREGCRCQRQDDSHRAGLKS